ncbi:MAG: 30S ribosomal protein S16 [Patescibacteria group bacterium]|nr:30S ribosomal protein S16 [Patescibacteria group bacterium]
MLRIRLTRRGKRNRPFFRIVVSEARAPIKGRFIEVLGGLDPLGKKVSLKEERIKYWLSCGAKPSDTVHNLLVDHKIITGAKIKKFAHRKKKGEEARKEEGTQQNVEKEEKPAEAEKEKQEDAATQKETADKEEKTEPAQKAPKEEPKPEETEGATNSKVEPLPTIETKP